MSKPSIKIGLLSVDNPDDKRVSSGTLYTISRNLGKIGTVKWIPVRLSRTYQTANMFAKAAGKLLHRNIVFGHTYVGANLIASGIDKRSLDDCDIIIAYWSGSYFGRLDIGKVPSIYVSDASFPSMVDYYPPFRNLYNWNIRQGCELEKRTMDKADAVVFSSDWAKDSAVNTLGQSSHKIHVIEFGANIDEKDLKRLPKEKDNGRLELLFLGVEWGRKGGDIAVAATKWLNENGVPAVLNIVGIRELDASIASLPYVNHIGFLNKNKPDDYRSLTEVINKSKALILPTQAECSAIAFAEASAYGLPIFTYRTGGVPNYIEEGINGYMLPLGSKGEEFGKRIAACCSDGRLDRMSKTAHEVYEQRLNWTTWTNKMINLIMNLIDKK